MSTEPAPKEEKAISKETILSLYLPAIILSLGTGIAAPVLPAYAKSFDVSFSSAALILIVQPWGGFVSTFPTGYMIDKLGRRPVILIGPVLTALSAFLTAAAPTFALLLVFRFLNGVAAQMWQQSRLVMISDSGGDRERGKLITWMTSMQRFGMLFAPAVGGLVGGIDLRLPFVLHGVLVLIALVPCYYLVKETAPVEERKRAKSESSGDWGYIFSELRRPQMLWFLTAQVFANLTRGNIQGIMNLYMAYEYNRGPSSLGLIASVNGLMNIPIGFMTGTIMDRYGRKKTVVPGFAGLFASGAFLAWTSYTHAPFAVFLVGFFLLNISQSITSGNMQVLGSDLAPARARGRFIGIWRMMAQLGNASSPTLFSLFALIGYAASFGFMAVSGLVVTLVIAFKVKETVTTRSKTKPDANGATPAPEPVAAGGNDGRSS